MIWRKAVEWISGKAVADRLDKRKLQQEIDTHKLYLLTSYFQAASTGTPSQDAVEKISADSQALSKEVLGSCVARSLEDQAQKVIHKLHEILVSHNDVLPTASFSDVDAKGNRLQRRESSDSAQSKPTEGSLKRPRRGLAAALGGSQTSGSGSSAKKRNNRDDPETHFSSLDGGNRSPKSSEKEIEQCNGSQTVEQIRTRVSSQQLSQLAKAALGFTLEVKRSGQAGGQSGDGLWIDGKAALGSLVAFYPGIVYPPETYRQIPGYPKIDRNNDYLIARFDSLIIDAQPWTSICAPPGSIPASTTDLNKQRLQSIAELSAVEIRNPFAWAHCANHPSAGVSPNVMLAALDLRVLQGESWRRAYMPNVIARLPVKPSRLSDSDDEQQEQDTEDDELVIPSLGLVATRPLENQEILLNYRLSTHVESPSWYTPVDKAEDKRRWS